MGCKGVAAAYGLSRPLIWFPRFIYCYDETPLKLKQLATTLARPAFAAISAAVLIMLLDSTLLANTQILLALLIDGLVYGLLYLAIWTILPQGKQTLLELFQLVKEFKKFK